MKLFYIVRCSCICNEYVHISYGGKMEELIKEAKEGNKEAFTELICEIRHDLYKIARVRLSCNDDIEDAVQETTIEAFKSIKNLKEINSFKKWIIKILINRCNRIYKRKRKITFRMKIWKWMIF